MLTARQMLIFKCIVEEFIENAEPVGSKALMVKYQLPYSSATIRNEMNFLENYGYLEKTHISSGRVPSKEGYRFYVNEILNNKSIKSVDYEDSFPLVDEILERNLLSREQAIHESMALVDDLTHYTSVAMGSSGVNARIRKLQFVPLYGKYAVILMVTDKGNVESKKIIIPDMISNDEVEKVMEQGSVTCLFLKNGWVIATDESEGAFIDFTSKLDVGDKVHISGSIYDVDGSCGGYDSEVEVDITSDSIMEVVK